MTQLRAANPQNDIFSPNLRPRSLGASGLSTESNNAHVDNDGSINSSPPHPPTYYEPEVASTSTLGKDVVNKPHIPGTSAHASPIQALRNLNHTSIPSAVTAGLGNSKNPMRAHFAPMNGNTLGFNAQEDIESYYRQLERAEQMLEEMNQAKLDMAFKDELHAIEEWYKVLSGIERTAAVYTLIQYITPAQSQFFLTILNARARRQESGYSPAINSAQLSMNGNLHQAGLLGDNAAWNGPRSAFGPGNMGRARSRGGQFAADSDEYHGGQGHASSLRPRSYMDNGGPAMGPASATAQYWPSNVFGPPGFDDMNGLRTAIPDLRTISPTPQRPASARPGSPNPVGFRLGSPGGLMSHNLASQSMVRTSSPHGPSTLGAGTRSSWNNKPRSPSPRRPGSAQANWRTPVATPTTTDQSAFEKASRPQASHSRSTSFGGNRDSASVFSPKEPPTPRKTPNSGSGNPGDVLVDYMLLENVPAWLKSLRLHKYTSIFERKHWKDIIALGDADLEKLGVAAQGARTKFLKVFAQIKEDKEARSDAVEKAAKMTAEGVKYSAPVTPRTPRTSSNLYSVAS